MSEKHPSITTKTPGHQGFDIFLGVLVVNFRHALNGLLKAAVRGKSDDLTGGVTQRIGVVSKTAEFGVA
jgi:hypothetical protein